jgi:hypothetical protein
LLGIGIASIQHPIHDKSASRNAALNQVTQSLVYQYDT